ncbi:MAG: hypothetical protein R3A80_06040 [Bdellovibrionota bacterium]
MDFSFKSLATIGIMVGAVAWFFEEPAPKKANSRKPTAIGRASSGNVEVYKPSVKQLMGTRRNQEAELNTEIVVEDDQIDIAEGAEPAVVEGRPAFEKYQEEIKGYLVDGNVDIAIDFAERKLEETLKSPNMEISSVGYLHEFIMQHVDDPDEELNVTVAALKGAPSPSVRRYLYDRFQNHSPNMMEDLDRELDAVGVSVD